MYIGKKSFISFLSFLITFVLVFVMISNHATAFVSTQYEDEANKLKTLGLFLGSDQGFELDRAPNRVEGAVMLVRLLGKENVVKEGSFSHPFTDVPSWADNYIGYMYENGLTKGIGNNQFGSSDLVNANTYTTFILRALGYDDSKGDFSWDKAVNKGVETGIIESNLEENYVSSQYHFLRDDLVHLSYAALEANLKDQALSLGSKLVAEDVFSADKSIEVGLKLNGLQNQLDDSIGDKVMLSFTKEDTDFWIPQHILKVDRETLPEAIKDFKYVFSGGNDKPTNDILEYLLHKNILEEGFGRDLERIDEGHRGYDDQDGLSMSSYNYNCLTFYSEDRQLLGYVLFDGVHDGEVTTKLFTYHSIDELDKPDGYNELLAIYSNLPSLTSGVSVLNLDGSGHLIFDPKGLPAELRHAKAIGFGSSESIYDEGSFFRDFFREGYGNGVEIGNDLISLQTNIRSGDNAIVTLYGVEGHVIAATIITPNQFKTSDPRFVYFSGTVNNGIRITQSDFKVERYINGELDTSFDGRVGFGTEYFGDDKPAAFRYGPLFIGSDNVEYRFTSLNDDLVNVVLKHY